MNGNLALFKNEGSYGIINDKGEVVLESDDYKAALAFDGYVLFMNKLQDPQTNCKTHEPIARPTNQL